ncbi:MAG: glyoxalase [Saprospiraceae bacterium]|nr:glyoxalase [Saprospiraceae bacterium]
MDQRISIRPKIKNIGSFDHKKNEEKFQNETLRPIIKMQHDLIVTFFQNYVISKKINFAELNADQKRFLINKIFRSDNNLRTELRGLIIGHFTVQEYETYTTMTREINRRMITMIKNRLMSLFTGYQLLR